MNCSSKLCIALSFAGLVGCGGGGSDATSAVTSTSSATPPPVTSKLTITGAVTDDPIDSAIVSFRVGDREFEASRSSDVSGGFSVDIEYDSLDDIVYGRALRNASGIHFLGDVMTVGDLLDRSTDGTVTGTRITNVTTAKFVLTRHSTDDGSIDSYDEFMQASRGVDPEALLNVGAAIKAVVEAIDGTTLPNDIDTTLDLAEGIVDGSSTFIDDLNVTSPGTLGTAIEKLLSDGFATEDFDEELVPGVYMSTTSLRTYALFEDGSGLLNSFDDSGIQRLSSWAVNSDGDLELTHASRDAKRDILQRLSASGESISINQKRVDTQDEAVTVDVANFDLYRFEGQFDATTAVGSYSNTNGTGLDFVLNAGGTGYFAHSNGTVVGDLTWLVSGDGRLVLDIGRGQITTLSMLRSDDGELRVLSQDSVTGGFVQNIVIQTFSQS
ncbi:MAG: hypothetical protein AB8G17_11125 [Gammaproteobacteria bacterium]